MEEQPLEKPIEKPIDVINENINPSITKKKKKKKKKKTNTLPDTPGKDYDTVARNHQSNPPSIPVEDLWPNHIFPVGELHDYTDNNLWRTTSAETRERDRIMTDEWNMVREAAECHRFVRKWAQTQIKPGVNLYDLCESIEAMNRRMVKAAGLKKGIAFPTGVSRNNIAAHYSPNPGDRNEILKENDVLKIDFGTQVNGQIVDCAWTYAYNMDKYGPLLAASKAATETGIKEAGIDAHLCEIGEAIQETMESYEITLDGVVYPIKSIANLNGHSIAPYRIHAGKFVPNVKGADPRYKMEEGEHYAIETFGSTGDGSVVESGDCSHFMKTWNAGHVPIRSKQAKSLFAHINKTYDTLAFCKRFLALDGQHMFDGALGQLVKLGLVTAYPPLCDKVGSYTSQFEHTILLRPMCKEVVSRGDDY